MPGVADEVGINFSDIESNQFFGIKMLQLLVSVK